MVTTAGQTKVSQVIKSIAFPKFVSNLHPQGRSAEIYRFHCRPMGHTAIAAPSIRGTAARASGTSTSSRLRTVEEDRGLGWKPALPSSGTHSEGGPLAASLRPVSPFRLTETALSMGTSATLAINDLVARKRKQGEHILHLGFGQASFPLPHQLAAALSDSARSCEYGPVAGSRGLRGAIASYLQRTRDVDVDPDLVIVAPGSKPLLFALLQILEGDLLLPVPSWVSYIPQAKLAGKRVCPIQTDPTDRLAMSVPALSNALYEARRAGADPRILLLNSPNNPTGGMFDGETASAIAAWAEEEGLVLISDEIYAELAHGSRKHLSPATFNPHNAIITGGISKSFSAGGWRLGYAALPRGSERVFAALEAMASEVWSAATMPVQQAAIVAFGDDPDIHAYLKASAFLHGRVTGALHTALTGLGVHCPRPFGGFYLYPDFGRWRQELIQRGVRTADDLALHLLEKWGIASLPGTQFGDRPENLCLRLSTSMLHDTESGAGQRAFWNVVAHMRTAADNHREPIVNPCPQLDETYRRFTQFISSMES